MARRLPLTALAVAALLGSGCAAMAITGAGTGSSNPGKAEREIDDTFLAGSVRDALSGNRRLGASRINVQARQGVIVLEGSVESFAGRQEAERTARGVRGVQGVINNLIVASTGTDN